MNVKNLYKRMMKLTPSDEICCLPYVVHKNDQNELHAFTLLAEEVNGEMLVFGTGSDYWVENDEYIHSKEIGPFSDKKDFFSVPAALKNIHKTRKKEIDDYLKVLQQFFDSSEEDEEQLYDEVGKAFNRAVPEEYRKIYSKNCPNFYLFFSKISQLYN